MAEKTPQKNRMLLGMVALNSPSLPRPQDMLETLTSLSGTAVPKSLLQAKVNALVLPLGGNTAGVALMPSPIPWSNLEGPCETAWWWPEAVAKMQGHNSHLLVALGGDEGDAARGSVMLTHLLAAVAAHVDAAGIYWGGGGLVHDPRVFLDEARGASPQKLPLHLWVDFRIEQNDDGTLRLFTTGMKSLEKMEIEVPHSRHTQTELFDFAYSIAEYLVAHGAEIRDGHTIGRSDDEKVPATHAPSMWDSQLTVLRLEY